MKIVGLKVFVAHVQRTNFVFVKIYTDDGIDGVGEATLEWKTMTIVAALEELERELIGRDPFAVDAIIERLHRNSYWRTGAVFRTALGGIEAALLDIKGKALGVPVFELLGASFAIVSNATPTTGSSALRLQKSMPTRHARRLQWAIGR